MHGSEVDEVLRGSTNVNHPWLEAASGRSHSSGGCSPCQQELKRSRLQDRQLESVSLRGIQRRWTVRCRLSSCRRAGQTDQAGSYVTALLTANSR